MDLVPVTGQHDVHDLQRPGRGVVRGDDHVQHRGVGGDLQEPGFLARSGAYEGCVGEAGVYDLVGNLHEWVSDVADAAFEARLRGEGVARSFQYWSPGNAVFMGGFYSTHGELGPGCTFTTIAHEARYHDYSTGFRCCADAK